MDFYCILPTNEFATKIGALLNSVPRRIFLIQGKVTPLRVWLLRDNPNPGGGFPYVSDPVSGSTTVDASLSLVAPGNTPFTLATAPLSSILNSPSFACDLNTATAEIETFLSGGLTEREAFLQIDIDDATPFRGQITLLAGGSAGTTDPLPEIASGNSDDITVAAAGTHDLVPTHLFNQWTQRIIASAGAGAYTHKLTLDNARARDGSIYRVRIDIASSSNPTIEIYDESIAGLLLDTLRGDSDNAVSYMLECEYNTETASWRKLAAYYV